MRTILIAFFVLLSVSVDAQIKGVDFSKAKHPNALTNDDMTNMDGILLTNSEGTYMFVYELTPVCIKHCVEKLAYILGANDCARLADSDDSLIPSYIESEYKDFGTLSMALKVGSAEIVKRWFVKEPWSIGWVATENYSMVVITNKVEFPNYGNNKSY